MATDQQTLELLEAIRRCMKLYQQIVQQELKTMNLTFVQIQVICILHQEAPLSLREVSRKIGSPVSSLSGVIDRLEKLHLVTRTRDQKDRRVVWITLTDKCKERIKNFPTNQAAFFRKYLGDMSTEEVEQLTKQLQLLINHLEKGIEMHTTAHIQLTKGADQIES